MGAAALAVLLASPSIGNGWILDDYWHRAVLLERPGFRELLGAPSEMFRFLRGDPERTGRLIDLGLLPWYTDPGVKAEMLQPLTVLTHRLDYALWPDSPALMHAQSLLWLGAATAAASLFYRRMLGATRAAGIAALLFAADDARGVTVGWLANRNALVAATFGVLALIAHDRRRRGGSRPAGLLAPLLLLAALFAKEEGIGTCAYLAAYAMFVDPAGRWRGCLALWPQAATVVAWAAFRSCGGYGVRDMGLYVDPMIDPGSFLGAALAHIPLLLLGQWGPIPSESASFLGGSIAVGVWWLAMGVLGLLALAMAPLLRRDPLARFWAAGMVLAAVPVSATMPADRLLTFVGLGASGLLAQFWAFVLERRTVGWLTVGEGIGRGAGPAAGSGDLRSGGRAGSGDPRPTVPVAVPGADVVARSPDLATRSDRRSPPPRMSATHPFGAMGGASGAPRRLPATATAWLLVAVHAVLAPIAAPLRAAGPLGPRWVLDRLYVRAPLDPSLEGRTVVIVNAPVALNAGYLVLRRDLSGQAGPSHTRVLAPAIPHVTVRRLNERTLAIAPARGYMAFVADKLFRSERRPFAIGDRVELTGMTATITSLTPDGRPAEVTFQFDRPLESPSLIWLCFRGADFVPFTPPAVGREIGIPFDWKAVTRLSDPASAPNGGLKIAGRSRLLQEDHHRPTFVGGGSVPRPDAP
jgi:hypothetical protein